MTNDVERHSPEVWRKAADSLRGEADASDAVAKVNRNGAPLLGDTRDLFRPKTGGYPRPARSLQMAGRRRTRDLRRQGEKPAQTG